MTRLSPLFTWRSAIVASDLGPNVRLVALVMSLHMNERGGSAWPSYATLSRETGLGRRSVMRLVDTLVSEGWLIVEPRHTESGRQTSNRYRATVPLVWSIPTDTDDGDDL